MMSKPTRMGTSRDLRMIPDLYLKMNVYQRRAASWALGEYSHSLRWSTFPETVVDLGCGTGDLTKEVLNPFLPKGTRIIGVDKEAAMIEYARRHHSDPNITYEVGDVSELVSILLPSTLKGRKVDKIFSFFFLQWIRRPEECMSQVLQVLKDGGQIFFVIVAKCVLWDAYREMATKPQWRQLMEDVEMAIAPFDDSHDAKESICQALSKFGVNLGICAVERREVRFPNREILKAACAGVDPWLDRIPETERDKYLIDLLGCLESRMSKGDNNIYSSSVDLAVVSGDHYSSLNVTPTTASAITSETDSRIRESEDTTALDDISPGQDVRIGETSRVFVEGATAEKKESDANALNSQAFKVQSMATKNETPITNKMLESQKGGSAIKTMDLGTGVPNTAVKESQGPREEIRNPVAVEGRGGGSEVTSPTRKESNSGLHRRGEATSGTSPPGEHPELPQKKSEVNTTLIRDKTNVADNPVVHNTKHQGGHRGGSTNERIEDPPFEKNPLPSLSELANADAQQQEEKFPSKKGSRAGTSYTEDPTPEAKGKARPTPPGKQEAPQHVHVPEPKLAKAAIYVAHPHDAQHPHDPHHPDEHRHEGQHQELQQPQKGAQKGGSTQGPKGKVPAPPGKQPTPHLLDSNFQTSEAGLDEGETDPQNPHDSSDPNDTQRDKDQQPQKEESTRKTTQDDADQPQGKLPTASDQHPHDSTNPDAQMRGGQYQPHKEPNQGRQEDPVHTERGKSSIGASKRPINRAHTHIGEEHQSRHHGIKESQIQHHDRHHPPEGHEHHDHRHTRWDHDRHHPPEDHERRHPPDDHHRRQTHEDGVRHQIPEGHERHQAPQAHERHQTPQAHEPHQTPQAHEPHQTPDVQDHPNEGRRKDRQKH